MQSSHAQCRADFFFIRHAFKAGYSVERIFELTKIARVLHKLRRLHELEEVLKNTR